MDNIASLKTTNTMDAINHRLMKARSITSTLLSSNFDMAQINPQYLYGVLWTLDEFLEEIAELNERL